MNWLYKDGTTNIWYTKIYICKNLMVQKQKFTMILRLETDKKRERSQKLSFQVFSSLSGS